MNCRNKKKWYIIYTVSLFFSQTSSAQLTTSDTPTPMQLVQNVLMVGGIGATDITYTGANIARGSFVGWVSDIGLDSGIILSTGNIANATGTNNSSSISADNHKAGDVDLDSIMFSVISHDASILEFDFIPTSDTVTFRYVFGSDEYMEFVDTTEGALGINDGFGFFLSGPGISGPYSGGAQNIAIIPGTTLSVTMHNLNLWKHSEFYIDNGDGLGTGGSTVQYDGFTVPLTATAIVECGRTYHIKLAIGDGGDGTIDSGIFLEGGSFESFGKLQITPTITLAGSIIDNNDSIYESCGGASLLFYRGTANLAIADTFFYSLSGSAVNGIDYAFIGDSIYFAPGQESSYMTISSMPDDFIEANETVILNFFFLTLCSTTDTVSSILYIVDSSPLMVSLNNDTTLSYPVHNFPLTAVASGGVGNYNYSWTGSVGTQDTINVSPAETTTYYVTVTDTCGNIANDSVKISVSTTGINENNIHWGDISMSPNPSKGDMKFIYSMHEISHGELIIYNLSGSKIVKYQLQKGVNNQIPIKETELNNGIYFYKMIADGETKASGKIVIIK